MHAFLIEPSQVQSQVRFNTVPEKVPEKVWEALVQSQVRFNRVPEKVPEKVWEALVQGYGEGSGEGSGRRSGRLWCRARSVSTGFAAIYTTHGNLAEVFPALGFAARFGKICKNKTLRLLGIPPKLILHNNPGFKHSRQYQPVAHFFRFVDFIWHRQSLCLSLGMNQVPTKCLCFSTY